MCIRDSLADSLFGHDPGDPATSLMPAPRLAEIAGVKPPVKPALAFVRQPAWESATSDVHDGFSELVEALGADCDEIELPGLFTEALRLCELVQLAELAKSYHHYEERGRERLSAEMQKAIDNGHRAMARDYLSARDLPKLLNDSLEAVFDRYDAIVTPAAAGAAPEGLESTGSAAFNGIWTFCGTPAVTLPLLQAENGLPVGVQLVGRRGDDGRLLRTARWLVDVLSQAE